MKYLILCLVCFLCAVVTAPAIRAAEKPATTKACVEKIHVIKGCAACEAMQDWLRKGGVELDITHVQTGPFKLYPMVVYSDKKADHGDRMYRQQVTIPGKICVESCSIGTN